MTNSLNHKSSDRSTVLIAGSLLLLICAWALAIFTFEQIRFAVFAPQAVVGVEAAAALARLFGALVLSLIPSSRAGQRLRWVAAGFAILGLGGFVFGFLQPLLFGSIDLNSSIYASMMVRTVAGALFVIGLVPAVPPQFTRSVFLVSLLVFGLLSFIVVRQGELLPTLANLADLELAIAAGDAPLQGLSFWHWALSVIPLVLSLAALYGAIRYSRSAGFGRWLIIAMVLLVGSQLHTMFWPSAYSPVLTTADLLRLLFAAVVAIGGVFELQRITSEYALLLAAAQEQSRRLNELARLKADFTAMVAHELSSPIAAIQGLARMLATGALPPELQANTITTIQVETEMLNRLVNDVQTAAHVEREDFAVALRPVPLQALLADAVMFAQTLPGAHPLDLQVPVSACVLADPERLGQVLRNLLSNAAKYSDTGTPITVRTVTAPQRVRIEVADRGNGIHPDDVARIFEKFGRGRDQAGRKVPGVGLGLYLSQLIVRAHGSELTVQSRLGEGSVFAFELEVER